MKFLALTFFVCAASAAVPLNNRLKAYAQASVSGPAFVPAVPAATVYDAVVPVNLAPAVKSVKLVGQTEDVGAQIVKSVSDVNPEGFSYSYETSNGISAESEGTLKNVNNVPTLTVQGRFAYTAPDGTPVHLTYIANEDGYQPDSALLPQAPAIPEAILRSLDYIAAHPSKEEQRTRN